MTTRDIASYFIRSSQSSTLPIDGKRTTLGDLTLFEAVKESQEYTRQCLCNAFAVYDDNVGNIIFYLIKERYFDNKDEALRVLRIAMQMRPSSIKQRRKNGMTYVHHMAKFGQMDFIAIVLPITGVEAFLKRDNSNNTPLITMIKSKYIENADILRLFNEMVKLASIVSPMMLDIRYDKTDNRSPLAATAFDRPFSCGLFEAMFKMMTPVNDDDIYKNNEKLLLSEYDDSTSLQLFAFNGDYDGVAFVCTRELRDIGRRKIIKIHGETKDRRKVTVLCQAIWNGHLKIAKYLLKETDVEFKRSYPWETSPLRFSVESDDLETVKWVRKHFSVLMKTDELSYLEMVYRLPSISLEILKYFGLIYDKRSFMRRFSDGRTIIHTSVENRRCDIIDYVSSVTHRMDINTVCSKTNVSPLQLATTLNFTNVVYCLLRNQAWLPSNTFSLLKATIENGNAELFLLFVRLGANPYQLDQQCLFLVDIACRCLKLDIIHAMIIYGLDINPRITDNMFNCINRIYIGWSEDAALMFITLSVLRGTSTFPVEITNRHPKAIEYHNSLTEDDRLEIRFQGYFSESLVVRLLGEIYRGYVCATFPCAHPSSRRIIGHS